MATKKAYEGPAWPHGKDDYLYLPVTSRRGHSSGDEVAAVQQALEIDVTGTYDDATVAAVFAFQKEHKLPVTGTVDRATWEALHG